MEEFNLIQFMGQFFWPIYSTIAGLVIGYLWNSKRKQHEEASEAKRQHDEEWQALKDGMAILLRSRLEEYNREYHDEESIPSHIMHDLTKTYNTYKALGGNSTGDKIYYELSHKHIV